MNMNAKLFTDLIQQLMQGKSAEMTVFGDGREYVREFLPNDRLIILGGGHVGLALSKMAAMLDFEITIVDDRPSFANHERFPEANSVICDSFENAISSLHIRATDYVCVLTRGHRWDQHCVEAVLMGEMPYYLGMIGSRRRVQGMKESLMEKGYSPKQLEQLHAPIGIPIGGYTPTEIALSICAEMIREKRRDQRKSKDNVLFAKNTDMETLSLLANGQTRRAMLLVLDSDGSTPVESGSMMAVDAVGKTCGTIGGGCSEAAAVAKARRIIGTGKSAVIDFDMSSEVAEENGMVCGGHMTVLIEDIAD